MRSTSTPPSMRPRAITSYASRSATKPIVAERRELGAGSHRAGDEAVAAVGVEVVADSSCEDGPRRGTSRALGPAARTQRARCRRPRTCSSRRRPTPTSKNDAWRSVTKSGRVRDSRSTQPSRRPRRSRRWSARGGEGSCRSRRRRRRRARAPPRGMTFRQATGGVSPASSGVQPGVLGSGRR